MAVKPEVQTVLDVVAAFETVPMSERTVEDARAAYGALLNFITRPEVAAVQDRTIPGPAGELPIRIYRPAGVDPGEATPPVLVWFHGGGWVIGGLESADGDVRKLANGAGAVVVSVDYRRAPEACFPAAADDAIAAVRWVAANADELGVDGTRLAVGGDSAGGNLAAVVSQQLRDSGPPICFQLLVYPVTDARLATASMEANGEGYMLTKEMMLWCVGHYLAKGDPTDARISPLCAPDEAFAGLPPALVITAELDPLVDEGEAYAGRLSAAGVETTLTRYDGVIHGFFQLGDLIPDGAVAMDEASAALRGAFRIG